MKKPEGESTGRGLEWQTGRGKTDFSKEKKNPGHKERGPKGKQTLSSKTGGKKKRTDRKDPKKSYPHA